MGLTRHVTSPLVSLRASTDRKTKETVALELSFVNSNLQLLKEQLAELNSSVEVKSVNLVGFLHLKNIEGVPSRAGRPPASGANDPPRSEGDQRAGAGGGVQGVDRESLLRGRGGLRRGVGRVDRFEAGYEDSNQGSEWDGSALPVLQPALLCRETIFPT